MELRSKRNYLLRDTFQSRFLTTSLLHFFLIILTFAVAVFLPLMFELEDPSLNVIERQQLANRFISLHEQVWPPILGILVLFVLHVVFTSHRIAGPLYRFRRLFQSIAEGDFSVSAQVRKGDYLHKEAELLNDMMGALRAKAKQLEDQHDVLQGFLTSVKHAVESGATEDVAERVRQLEEQMKLVRAHVGRLSHGDQLIPQEEAHRADSTPAPSSLDHLTQEGSR